MSDKTYTRADLAEAVHKSIGLTRTESAMVVEQILDMIIDSLVKGDVVKLSGFGVFTPRDKTPRIGRNPKTGEAAPITARTVVTFRPSQLMKSRVDRALSK